MNRGNLSFAEVGQWAGVSASDWAWGVCFLDVDLDGFEDVLISNGHEAQRSRYRRLQSTEGLSKIRRSQ